MRAPYALHCVVAVAGLRCSRVGGCCCTCRPAAPASATQAQRLHTAAAHRERCVTLANVRALKSIGPPPTLKALADLFGGGSAYLTADSIRAQADQLASRRALREPVFCSRRSRRRRPLQMSRRRRRRHCAPLPSRAQAIANCAQSTSRSLTFGAVARLQNHRRLAGRILIVPARKSTPPKTLPLMRLLNLEPPAPLKRKRRRRGASAARAAAAAAAGAPPTTWGRKQNKIVATKHCTCCSRLAI